MKNEIELGPEFEAIYPDGTRKRIRDGILLDVGESGAVDLYVTNDRPEPMLDAVEAMLLLLSSKGVCMGALTMPMMLDEDARKVVSDLVDFGSAALAADVDEIIRSCCLAASREEAQE